MNTESGLGFYLLYSCVNCGNKYGALPEYCGLCGCNRFSEIPPEYYSLELKISDDNN